MPSLQPSLEKALCVFTHGLPPPGLPFPVPRASHPQPSEVPGDKLLPTSPPLVSVS